MDLLGASIAKGTGVSYVEKCNPYLVVRSLRNIPTETSIPDLGRGNFVAPSSTLIGDIKLGQNSSIWYGAVLRGDLSPIEIGEDCVIQDLVTIKRATGSQAIRIGRGVTIGPNCFIGGVVIEDYAYVGMGSTLGEGSILHSYAVIAAGAVVEPASEVPSGQVWAGSPAKFLRNITPDEREAIREHHTEMRNLAAIHSEETEKTFEQIFEDEVNKERSYHMNYEENLTMKMESLDYLNHPIDMTEVERVRGSEYAEMHERHITELYVPKSWRPFKEDAGVFPEDWKIYGEDMTAYDRAKKMFDQPPKPRDDTPIPAIPTDQTPWTRRY